MAHQTDRLNQAHFICYLLYTSGRQGYMDIIEGGNVLPKPLKAPAVVISIHINNWEKPKIRK